MKEQSHKDEMSAALRGDFKRLRERGVAVALAPPDAEPTEAETVQHELTGPAEPMASSEPELQAGEAVATEPEPVDVTELESRDDPGAPPSSWVDRLLGR